MFNTNVMMNALLQNPIFKGLSENHIEKLFTQIYYRKKSFNAEEIIAVRNDPCEVLNILIDGSIRGEMFHFSGKIIKIEDIDAPDTFASAFLYGERQKYPVDVIGNTKGEILQIPKTELTKLLKDKTVLTNFLDIISTRTQTLADKFWYHNFNTIREKFADYLLETAGKDQVQIELNKTQKQLAEIFGVTRPSLAREISEMEKEGYITCDRKLIKIHDKKALKNILVDE